MNKEYYCYTEFYDYFGGQKFEKVFLGNNPVDAIKKYRDEKGYKFNYGDSWYSVGKIHVKYIPDNPRIGQREHARHKLQWERMQRDNKRHKLQEEIKFITSFFIVDDDDDDIII